MFSIHRRQVFFSIEQWLDLIRFFVLRIVQSLDVLNFGDAGYCSRYFWLAKWALYHLTFIPITIKSRGIFFRLVSNYELFLFVRKKFKYAIDYLEIVITIWWVALVLEMRGIDPRTSRMLSERSTIWATSTWFITFEEAFVSVGKQEFKIFLVWYFLYKTSIFSSFLKKVN